MSYNRSILGFEISVDFSTLGSPIEYFSSMIKMLLI